VIDRTQRTEHEPVIGEQRNARVEDDARVADDERVVAKRGSSKASLTMSGASAATTWPQNETSRGV